jgi:hypothetical protein
VAGRGRTRRIQGPRIRSRIACPSGPDAMAPGRGRGSSHVPRPDATDCFTSGPRLDDDAGRARGRGLDVRRSAQTRSRRPSASRNSPPFDRSPRGNPDSSHPLPPRHRPVVGRLEPQEALVRVAVFRAGELRQRQEGRFGGAGILLRRRPAISGSRPPTRCEPIERLPDYYRIDRSFTAIPCDSPRGDERACKRRAST